MDEFTQVCSPISAGNGAFVVHKTLEKHLRGYRVTPVSPYWSLAPQLLRLRPHAKCPVTHTTPEMGPYGVHPASRLVVTFHNYYLDREMMRLASPAQALYYRCTMAQTVRESLKRAEIVTAVSNFTADLVRRHHSLHSNRLIVVKNGVDTELFSPRLRPSKDGLRVLFVGNPTRRKGSQHLAALARELPDGVELAYTAGLRHSALKPPSPDERLIALPKRTHADMPDVYRDADILFFPTQREGLSLAVLEAMASGLPVVATDCSSMSELIDHGKGGFLFDSNNRRQMLQFIIKLVQDPTLREDMGSYNRLKAVADFPLKAMLDSYRDVFASLL